MPEPRPVPELVIIADDLSGAADCGVMCTAAGLRTLVILGDHAAPHAEALAVDADTRGRSEAEAVATTIRLTRRYAAAGTLLYRKLDSTLRGHVGAELAATLRTRREHGPAFIVFAPAFPAMGRTTVDGVQRLHGVPLQDTEMWQRERIAHSADIPAMLRRAGLRASCIMLTQIRRRGLRDAIASLAKDHDAVICDAETEADLETIALAAPVGTGTIWAGSAGLARHLPRATGLARHGPAAIVPPAAGPILFVVGSLASVSRDQVAALEREAGMRRLVVPAAILRAGPHDPHWAAQERALDTALDAGDVVAQLGSDGPVDLPEGLRLCHALARMVAPHARRIGALVSTGGETARAVLQAFDADGLHLVGEIEPGVPLAITDSIHPLPVATKAGAFGTRDTLIRCRAALRRGFPATALTAPET